MLGSSRMPKVTIIDLSIPIENNLSEPQSPEVTHLPHSRTGDEMATLFGCEKSDLPDELGWANDLVKIQAHTGTH